MDYFSVIVLIIVVFIFATDRKVKSINIIQKEKQLKKIYHKINNIKSNLQIIKIDIKELKNNNLSEICKIVNKKYVLFQNAEIDLNEQDVNTLVANYISVDKRPCGFNLLYVYEDLSKKLNIKRIYLDIINYLNIFNKRKLSTYGVIILKAEDGIDENINKRLISYNSSEITKIRITKNDLNLDKLKKIYIEKLKCSDISIIIKILFLIISGSIITTNVIYSLLNLSTNLNDLLISIVIYCCYSYIIRYIYEPIGKQRIIASYIFPIYFIAYIGVAIYTFMSKVIKKVHAS